jgi:hypothetical protein
MRHFDKLNAGKPFPSRYDRRHEFSLMLQHNFSEKWSGSCVWTIASGNPVTLPSQRFSYFLGFPANTPVSNQNAYYSQINAYRLPIYHRADIAFTYTPKPKRVKKIHSTWNFAAYNLYNRLNPFFMYLEETPNSSTPSAKALAIFPLIPSATWNFKF